MKKEMRKIEPPINSQCQGDLQSALVSRGNLIKNFPIEKSNKEVTRLCQVEDIYLFINHLNAHSRFKTQGKLQSS